VPPAAASMKLAVVGAKFVLGPAVVTEKAGPDTICPAMETVIGPLVAPAGTRTVMLVRFVLTTLAGIPLKRTSTSEIRELNSAPVIVTRVAPDPVKGLTLLICGGSAV